MRSACMTFAAIIITISGISSASSEEAKGKPQGVDTSRAEVEFTLRPSRMERFGGTGSDEEHQPLTDRRSIGNGSDDDDVVVDIPQGSGDLLKGQNGEKRTSGTTYNVDSFFDLSSGNSSAPSGGAKGKPQGVDTNRSEAEFTLRPSRMERFGGDGSDRHAARRSNGSGNDDDDDNADDMPQGTSDPLKGLNVEKCKGVTIDVDFTSGGGKCGTIADNNGLPNRSARGQRE